MIIVSTVILETKEYRKKHIDLSEKCVERGGTSTHHKGVLAQYLGTDIPSGRILLCHACHNGKCSNPKHIYWGTDKDNREDYIENGGSKSIWENVVKKHGLKEAKKLMGKNRNHSKAGRVGGSKRKSLAHRKKISIALKNNKNAKKL